MINLEEEARKRRERLKSAFSTSTETSETKKDESVVEIKPETKAESNGATFEVPEGEVLLDSSGAEILSLDSK